MRRRQCERQGLGLGVEAQQQRMAAGMGGRATVLAIDAAGQGLLLAVVPVVDLHVVARGRKPVQRALQRAAAGAGARLEPAVVVQAGLGGAQRGQRGDKLDLRLVGTAPVQPADGLSWQ